MPKKIKEKLSDDELEKLHQEFSQKLANAIYDSIEKFSSSYEKKYEYESSVSIFNVLLSITSNVAVELGMSEKDLSDVSKEFWKSAHEILHSDELEETLQDNWLEPKAKSKKDLS